MTEETGGRDHVPEAGRIAFLLQRDGHEATVQWIASVIRIYRRAVLNKSHFASTPYYRRRFICSYCDFKRWLGSVRRERPSPARSAAADGMRRV